MMHRLREKERKDDSTTEKDRSREPAPGDVGHVRIRCPLCGWKHDGRAHWGCELCGSIFDTFETGARCPEATCGNSWHLTWCPSCGDPSPHEEWYVEEQRKS
jgi:hypothetical protein